MKPELFDLIELLVDLPEHNLRPGARGAIVHCHPDDTYEVEFTNENGETVALCPLSADQFIVVWQAQPVPGCPFQTRWQLWSPTCQKKWGGRCWTLRFLRMREQWQQAASLTDPATMVQEKSA